MNYRAQLRLINNETLWFLLDEEKFETMRDQFDDKNRCYITIDKHRFMKSAIILVSWEAEGNV